MSKKQEDFDLIKHNLAPIMNTNKNETQFPPYECFLGVFKIECPLYECYLGVFDIQRPQY